MRNGSLSSGTGSCFLLYVRKIRYWCFPAYSSRCCNPLLEIQGTAGGGWDVIPDGGKIPDGKNYYKTRRLSVKKTMGVFKTAEFQGILWPTLENMALGERRWGHGIPNFSITGV